MDMVNLNRLELYHLCFDGGGGSGGGTQSTTANMMPWKQYVPEETYEGYKKGMVYAGGKVGEGLTPEEKQKYTGDIISTTGKQFAGAQKELTESLARSGVEGGAKAEAISDLNRSKAMGTATGLSGLATTDIEEKRKNLEEYRRWIGLPSAPVQVGSTTTSSPSGGGGMS